MHLTSLHLRNFRNYQRLDLELPPGLVVITGGNAQGKSNLLEAVYLLAIGRSPRATNEREMVSWEALEDQGYGQVAATVDALQGSIRLQVDFQCLERPSSASGPPGGVPAPPGVQKRVRINGVSRLTSELVGQLNAVLFDAADIQLIEGTPSLRRRYLDILLSQVDSTYLRALQRYQRVLSQRNHLLRLIRERRGREDELEFWDGELTQQGASLLASRFQAVATLAELAAPLYARLSGTEVGLDLEYLPTTGAPQEGEEELGQTFREALLRQRQREVALGMTQVGPHRDDLRLTVGGREVGLYGSRGDRRIAALALRLAEGEFLATRRGDEPVLLLDDILSELDSTRRQQVLKAVGRYRQVLMTTTEAAPLDGGDPSPSAVFRVVQGTVERV